MASILPNSPTNETLQTWSQAGTYKRGLKDDKNFEAFYIVKDVFEEHLASMSLKTPPSSEEGIKAFIRMKSNIKLHEAVIGHAMTLLGSKDRTKKESMWEKAQVKIGKRMSNEEVQSGLERFTHLQELVTTKDQRLEELLRAFRIATEAKGKSTTKPLPAAKFVTVGAPRVGKGPPPPPMIKMPLPPPPTKAAAKKAKLSGGDLMAELQAGFKLKSTKPTEKAPASAQAAHQGALGGLAGLLARRRKWSAAGEVVVTGVGKKLDPEVEAAKAKSAKAKTVVRPPVIMRHGPDGKLLPPPLPPQGATKKKTSINRAPVKKATAAANPAAEPAAIMSELEAALKRRREQS
jgi:hypothetical protein